MAEEKPEPRAEAEPDDGTAPKPEPGPRPPADFSWVETSKVRLRPRVRPPKTDW